ncbi:MAG: hypothetical protein KKF56_01050 [Nanoarchaeota archaeon]|nr:hypothetical protein [Nanoarchaeota archaeon]
MADDDTFDFVKRMRDYRSSLPDLDSDFGIKPLDTSFPKPIIPIYPKTDYMQSFDYNGLSSSSGVGLTPIGVSTRKGSSGIGRVYTDGRSPMKNGKIDSSVVRKNVNVRDWEETVANVAIGLTGVGLFVLLGHALAGKRVTEDEQSNAALKAARGRDDKMFMEFWNNRRPEENFFEVIQKFKFKDRLGLKVVSDYRIR